MMALRHYGVWVLAEEKKKSDLADKFVIRMPDGLRDRIAAAAAENKRSMNAEVIAALEKAFPEIPDWEEFTNDIEFILSAYKSGKAGHSRWSRSDLRKLLTTVVQQIAYHDPEAAE